MKINYKKRYLLVILFPLGYIINLLSRADSIRTERYYSNFIYRGISWLVGKVSGLIPFSIVELLVLLLIVFTLYRLVNLIKKLLKGKGRRLKIAGTAVMKVAMIASVIYFLFIMMWGLNYNRLSLAEIIGLEVKESSVDELSELTEDIAYKTNAMRPYIEENEDGVMVPSGGAKEGFKRYDDGYRVVAKSYPELGGAVSRPKPILSSKLYAYTSIWGIYSPFTVESNINMEIPSPMLLSTMMHELAHQVGFAREDEANYIAYITCINHPDIDFQYSGLLFGLNNCLNALFGQDSDEYKRIYNLLNDGVIRDLNENNRYHDKYSGRVSRAVSKTNDAYLRANNQEDGVLSYGRMVDLMLAEYRQAQGR